MGSNSKNGGLPAVKEPWIKTPLVESAALSKVAGCRIFLKLENLQPSGSFKSRGIGNLIRQAIISRPSPSNLHFYSSSGGNAGLACVTAARTLGYPATVVVPFSTKPMMIAKIKTAGATNVIQIGASWYEADKHLREEILAKDPNGVYVPPFDHPDIWTGAATMVDEIAQQLTYQKPDAIICSVGGGGLFTGLMEGLDRVYKHDRPVDVLAVETQGAESLHKSLEAGKLEALDRITSIATSLGAIKVAEKAFQYAQKPNVKSVVLSDGEAATACVRFADEERMIVEAACGASVAVCYQGKLKKLLPKLTAESKVIVVVCGGSNINLGMLEEYRETYGKEGISTNAGGVVSNGVEHKMNKYSADGIKDLREDLGYPC